MITPCTVSGIACRRRPARRPSARAPRGRTGCPRHAAGSRSRLRSRSLDRRRPIPAARALAGAQRADRDLRDVRAFHPGRAVAGPVGGDQEDPGREQLADQRRQELLRRPIDPVQILNDDDEWPLGRCLQEQQAQRIERARLDRFGAERLEGSGLVHDADQAKQPRARVGRQPIVPHGLVDGLADRRRRVCLEHAAVRAEQIDQRQIGHRLPYDTQRPSRMMLDSARAAIARVASYTSRDLPMPGSPTTLTAWPLPATT